MNERVDPILTMRDIHVTYGSHSALKGVAFDLMPGEIHAIAGEHRAGKSSLVKILSGAVPKSYGEIRLFGQRQDIIGPEAAADLGIGMVYQEPHVIPYLNARDNIFTGRCPVNRLGILDKKTMERRTKEIFESLELDFDPMAPLTQLSDAQQNMVEVARLMVLDPKIVIFDEIGTKLNPREMKTVYRFMRELKEKGTGIIYISHDMDEILRLADRVTILRDGYRRSTEFVDDLDKYRLFELTYSYVLDRDEMKRDADRLPLMRRLMENALHHLPVGTILLDEKESPVVVNFFAKEILGPDMEIQEGFDVLLSALSETNTAMLNNAMAKRVPVTLEDVPFNDSVYIRIQVLPYNEPAFAFKGTILLLQDVTDSRKISDFILQSDKMASVAEVAVGVAHEINNPLFIIQNYVEIIKSETSSHHVEFAKIEKELSRIVEIIGSLLSFSRVKPARNPAIDLREIIEDVLILLNHSFKAKSISVDSRIGEFPVKINGEENRIKQLLMNLLNNAIEAVLNRGEIGVFLGVLGKEAIITITDDGHGIPDDIRRKIFDPFFSTKMNKKNTGLGLAITRQVAEDYGGSMDFESEPGRSTTFRVRLPLSDVSE